MGFGVKTLSAQQRQQLQLELLEKVNQGEMTQGELLRFLRKEIFGMNQQQYATLVQVSRRTLSDIEADTGNQSVELTNKVLRPLGLELGLKKRVIE